MARWARLTIPGLPHHVMQEGNGHRKVFFQSKDYLIYLSLMSVACSTYNVEVWAYCLMPNHVHLVVVPETKEGMSRAIGEAHHRYALQIHTRQHSQGHLWYSRFTSYPMDDDFTLAATRFLELEPKRARLCRKPGDYLWSSAAAHLSGFDDRLVKVKPLLDLAGDWERFLIEGTEIEKNVKINWHERSGRPRAGEEFIKSLEVKTQRPLAPLKRGPKPQVGRR